MLKPPLSYVLGGLVAVIALGPQIAGLYREWIDFRAGRRGLELERDRLQLLKLQLEIEALQRQYGLVDTTPRAEAADRAVTKEMPVVQPAKPPAPAAAPAPPPGWATWLLARPTFGRPVLLVLQAVFGLWAAFSAVAVIAVPFTLLVAPTPPERGQAPENAMSPLAVIVLAVVYALFAWAFWIGYRRVRRWRRSQAAGS